MTSIVQARLTELSRLCATYRARRLDVFGSAARDEDFDPDRSDLDFLVEFESMPPDEHADSYFGLLFALEDLFGRPIDLVEMTAVRNPYVRAEIERTRELLYAA
jgi:predicted nucleotidyltransferase